MTDLNWVDNGHGTLQQDYRGWLVEVEPLFCFHSAVSSTMEHWNWRAQYMRQSHGDMHTGITSGTRQTEQEAKAAAIAAVDTTEDVGLRDTGSSDPNSGFDLHTVTPSKVTGSAVKTLVESGMLATVKRHLENNSPESIDFNCTTICVLLLAGF